METNPNEPTLTCSEVVERLAEECRYQHEFFDRKRATAILHSWRERRVQELEELLAKHSGCSHCNDSARNEEDKSMAKEIRYKWTGAAYVPDPPITTEEAVAYLRSIGIKIEYEPALTRKQCKHERLNADGVCECGFWVGNPSPDSNRWTPELKLFHELWGKAVEAADYVKSDWQKLEHDLFFKEKL